MTLPGTVSWFQAEPHCWHRMDSFGASSSPARAFPGCGQAAAGSQSWFTGHRRHGCRAPHGLPGRGVGWPHTSQRSGSGALGVSVCAGGAGCVHGGRALDAPVGHRAIMAWLE
jgi:hypothetical protein